MFALAFGSAFLIWFSTMETVLCSQGEDEARHGASLGQRPFHGVGDDIPVVKLARELVHRLEEDGAPLPYVFVKGFHLTLDDPTHSTAPWAFFTSTLAMAASRRIATWAETTLWSSSGPCFISTANWWGARHAAHLLGEKLGGGIAYESSDDLSDGEGADSAIGFGGGDDSRREVGTEDLCWDVGCGESPKGFPHASTRVSVKFGHPRPMFVPSTTRSRGSVGGRKT